MTERSARDEPATSIRAAEVVLPCTEIQPTLDFFVQRLGFRLDRISPADDPRTALISGHGSRLLLRRGDDAPPGVLHVSRDDQATLLPGELVAPNGTLIELEHFSPEPTIPQGRRELAVARAGAGAEWVTGRAGMRYRDLIPGRLGGRFIASHIQIPEGGPVPDQVHFHELRFQMIYCVRGWVRVVYEDQGPPLVLAAGDCVLQPARIRHRVLESSPGLEVVELACPAEHDTWLDHELELPTASTLPQRDFGGQRFVRHEAERAAWRPCAPEGFECRDTGIAEATGGLAGARVLRAAGAVPTSAAWVHDGELLFVFVLAGELVFEGATTDRLRLGCGDSAALPARGACALGSWTDDLEFLEVRLPAGTGNP